MLFGYDLDGFLNEIKSNDFYISCLLFLLLFLFMLLLSLFHIWENQLSIEKADYRVGHGSIIVVFNVQILMLHNFFSVGHLELVLIQVFYLLQELQICIHI